MRGWKTGQRLLTFVGKIWIVLKRRKCNLFYRLQSAYSFSKSTKGVFNLQKERHLRTRYHMVAFRWCCMFPLPIQLPATIYWNIAVKYPLPNPTKKWKRIISYLYATVAVLNNNLFMIHAQKLRIYQSTGVRN